jgi:hypothetical protein
VERRPLRNSKHGRRGHDVFSGWGVRGQEPTGKPIIEELPFFDRPDLTPHLVHLTKNTKKKNKFSAFDNLISNLRHGEICRS